MDNLNKIQKRALKEAEERRKLQVVEELPIELGGYEGPEPTKHGGWSHKGICTDF